MSGQQSLFDMKAERRKRDDTLDLLEERRRNLITRAQEIAIRICRAYGTVTSPEVMLHLKEEDVPGYGEVDPRFMGAVFRRGWKRVGYKAIGSHARPVSVWAFAKENP